MRAGRKPQAPRFSGVHGGSIERESNAAAQAVEHREAAREAGVNALEAALARTPQGRQVLDLLAEVARLRIHEGLAGELVASSADALERIRRELLNPRGPLPPQRPPPRIPAGGQELAKWRPA